MGGERAGAQLAGGRRAEQGADGRAGAVAHPQCTRRLPSARSRPSTCEWRGAPSWPRLTRRGLCPSPMGSARRGSRAARPARGAPRAPARRESPNRATADAARMRPRRGGLPRGGARATGPCRPRWPDRRRRQARSSAHRRSAPGSAMRRAAPPPGPARRRPWTRPWRRRLRQGRQESSAAGWRVAATRAPSRSRASGRAGRPAARACSWVR